MSLAIFGAGAVLVGVLIALTKALKWPSGLIYLWAGVVFAWGVLALI
jgi:hypothetical protein